MAIKLSWRSKSLFMYALYIPPNAKSEVYKLHFENINFLFSFANVNDITCVLGDFNLPNIDWYTDNPTEKFVYPINVMMESDQKFLDAIQTLNLYQICNLHNLNGRYLDLVFINIPIYANITKSFTSFVPERSHHFGIEISFNSSDIYCKFSNECKISFNYNYRKADVPELNNFLNNIDWKKILEPKSFDVDKLVDEFYRTIYDAFDIFIPKYLKKESNRPPWFNKNLTNLRNRKNRAHRAMKLSQHDNSLKNKFIKLRKEFDQLNKVSYKKYIDNVENDLMHDAKNFWKFVNTKRKTSGYPATMFLNDVEASNNNDICNLFASFFQSGYKNFDENDIPAERTFNSNHPKLISAPSITEDEIWNCICKLKHGCGGDLIPSSIIKSCASSLLQPLSIIFNRSLQQGIFPNAWKFSIIIPIYKSGKRTDI